MRSSKKYLYFTLLLICLLTGILTSPVYSVRDYQPTVEDPMLEKWRWVKFPELSGKGVRCMIEDNNSSMWFGLDNGLIKYNGHYWQEYTSANGFTNAPVRAIYCTQNGNIYAGSDSGLFVYRGSEWQNILPTPVNSDLIFIVITQLDSENILCGTNYGLIWLQSSKIKIFTTEKYKEKWQGYESKVVSVAEEFSVADNLSISDICVLDKNDLWFATGYDYGMTGKIIKGTVNNKNKDKLDFQLMFSENLNDKFHNGAKIIKTTDKKIWIINNQHDQGLLIYDNKKFKKFNLGKQFGEDEIHSSIQESKDGNLFIGGLGKIYTYNKNKWQLYRSPEIPIPSSTRILMYESSDGSMWIAGRQNEVYKLDYSHNTWATYRHLNFEGESDNGKQWFISVQGRIVCRLGDKWISYGIEDGVIEAPVRVFITKTGEIWAAGSHNGVAATAYLSNEKWYKQLHPNLSWNIDYRAVFEDQQGNLWFGGNIDVNLGKGQKAGTALLKNPSVNKTKFIYYPSKQREPGAYGLGQSKDGKMWMAGIGACNIIDDEWQVVDSPEELKYHTDYSCSSEDGVLWIGSRYYGVFRFDGREWKNYTIADGLVSNSVTYILPESDDCTWIATDKGISKFDGQSWTNHVFPDELTIVREGGSLRRTRKGSIWINKTSREWNRRTLGGKKALTEKMLKYRTVFYQPDTLCPETSISLYDKQVYQPGNTLISWAGLDPWSKTSTEKLQYSYRIDSKDWSPFSYKTNNIFLSLPDGDHRFEVRARDMDYNIDPDPAIVTFNVAPPFYRQPLFYIPMLLLIIIIVLLQIRVMRRGKKLQASKRETDNILHNVDEGLMLINSDCIISNQYSTVLEKIFEESSLAQVNLLDILKDKIDDELLKTTNDFLELLFKENYDQSMMDDLNPLSDANLTFNNKKIKYLDFNFRNIETGYGNDKEVMVTVKDITEQVKLEHKLEESQQDAQRQMDWLVNILHVDPPLLQEFIVSANEEIANVEKLLSEGLDNKNGADILKTVYRSMHLIKGNASLLALKAFSEQAHEFEEKINQIQRKKTIDKNDLQTLCAELAGIKKTLNEVNKLLERIGKIHEQMRPRRSYEHKVMIQSFQNLVSQLSEEQSKPIRLETKDFKIEEIPHNNRIFTKEIMVQLIRNSVAHGIEEASQRKENNKPEEAEIIIKTEADDHGFSFSVRDDGHGIQLKKLRQQAEKSGKWDLKELSEWDDQKMIALVYEHGISTNENTDLISGRGVGLDLVKEKVQSKNGTIDIDFETGKYCQFTIKIPINK